MQILKELEEVLSNDIVDRHSFFQLKHFIINSHYTTQGKLWQCLRELRSRKTCIEQYLTEIEETNDRIKLFNIEKEKNNIFLEDYLNKETNEKLKNLAVQEAEIKSNRTKRQVKGLNDHIKNLQSKIDDYVEESRFFLNEFNLLQTVEFLKPLDDLQAQKDYWTTKLHQEINLKLLLRQPLDIETIKLILTLPDDLLLKQGIVRMLETLNSDNTAIERATNGL